MPRFAVVPLVLMFAAAQATDLSAQESPDLAAVLGAWEMTVETPRGSMTQTFTFAADGDRMEGTLSARNGTVELEEVGYQDGTITFQVTRAVRDREVTVRYSATIDGDTMSGTASGGPRRGERAFTAVRSS